MVWSTEPGLELFSPEGRLVRATEEAHVIELAIGLKYTYLGFIESLGPDQAYNLPATGDVGRSSAQLMAGFWKSSRLTLDLNLFLAFLRLAPTHSTMENTYLPD